MLVSSNRASYRRLLALKHINELPAYFFISCKRKTVLSTWHAWIIASLLDASLANRRGRQYTFCCQETIGVGRPPSRFFSCWSNLLPAERKTMEKPKNWLELFVWFCIALQCDWQTKLAPRTKKIPITTSTFNGMELSIILIARLPDCLFTCVSSYLLILWLVMSIFLFFGGPHLKTVLISYVKII